MRYFHGSPVLKSPPANAGGTGSSLVWADPTCHRITKPMPHSSWAFTLGPVLHIKRSHCKEKLLHHRGAPAHCN